MPETVDLTTLVLSLFGSVGAAVGAARWFAKSAIEHAFATRLADHQSELSQTLARNQVALDNQVNDYQAALDKQVNDYQAGLDKQVNEARARLEDALRQSTETMLGEEAAERSYRFEARKRLYTAVGPLRFQLIQAAVQLRSRVGSFARENITYDTRLGGYFGRSILFRIGQVLALTELIERQIAYADFAVDPGMVSLLRFRSQVMRALSDGDVSLGHKDEDWTCQSQHIFRDQLTILAVSMMVAQEGRPDRVVRFDEFLHTLDTGAGNYMQPLAGLIDGFQPQTKPILWLRMLALAEACGGLLEKEAAAIAVEPPPLDLAKLLALSEDEQLEAEKYLEMLADIRAKATPPNAPGPRDPAPAGAPPSG